MRRFTDWLCLFAALLMAVAPAQRLVLCIEPDGTIGLEAPSAAASCTPCVSSAAREQDGRETRAVAPDTCCLCTDIPIGDVHPQPRTQPKAADLGLHDFASLPALFVAPCLPNPPDLGAAAPTGSRSPPRAPPTLAHLRTVVLLV